MNSKVSAVIPGARFWDGVAEKYAKRPVGDVAAYEHTLERTRAYLRPDAAVLEIGCGTGTTALKLSGDCGSILATDISPEMIRIALERLEAKERAGESEAKNVGFRIAPVFDAQLAPQSFDAVLAFNLLHLVEDAPATLARVHALLKPGGVFVSKTVCLGGRAWLFGPMIWILRQLGKAPKVAMLNVKALDAMVRDVGFEIVETGVFPAFPPCRFIAARKL